MRGRLLSVSGPPGAGKSTLARALSDRLGWALVEFDRYETMTRREVSEIAEWLDRGADYTEIPASGLQEALRHALAGGNAVFDSPLGKADPRTAELVDFSVWLDCPDDIALARKLRQFAGQVPPGREAGFVAWMKQYLDAHEKVVRRAIGIQRQRVRPLADLRIDGTADVQAQIERILSASGAGRGGR